MMKNKTILWLALAFLMVLIIAYANHFYNGFHFDDYHTILDNVHIRSLSNIPRFFWDPSMFSADPEHFGLRSLVTTTLAIDYWLGGGLNLFYFHLSTFVWHIGLTVMLFYTYRNLMNRSQAHPWIDYIALFAAALFSIHTVNAETINYIISRSDVQSTFCIVASFLIFIAYPAKRKWFLYAIPAAIGVFAKETMLVLIILLFFYMLLFEANLSIRDIFRWRNRKVVGAVILKMLPLFLVVLAVQLYTLTRITAVPGISNSPIDYWFTQTYVWFHYFTSFFLPINLSADTDLTVITSKVDGRIWIGILFIAAFVLAVFSTSRSVKNRPVAFGLIWFAASLLPTSVAPFAEVMNDHRMYFAFVGLTLSVVWALGLWLISKEAQIRAKSVLSKSIISVAIVVLLAHGWGVYQRNGVWYSEETLWQDVTIKSPKNGRGYMNYGLALLGKGEIKEALANYERAQTLVPEYSRVYTNMGIAHGILGNHQAAEENFLKGIYYGSTLYESYVYFARYYKEQKRYEEARTLAERALLMQPKAMITIKLLMEIYMHLEVWGELERTSVLALSLEPSDVAAAKMLSLAKMQKTGSKSKLKPEAAKEPSAEDFLNLSLAFYNMGNYQECIDYCKKALALRADYADAFSNMAAAFNKLKQWDKGVEASQKALAINPNHKLAKGNLEWALRKSEN